jgi:NAD(P)-dependent dehydrogenase (short-subunit alcohol dehydrogenase family)
MFGKLMDELKNSKFRSNFDLTNKWAVISGGAGLLGKQHSIALLELNANVVLIDLDLQRLNTVKTELQKRFTNQKVLIFAADISNEKSILEIQSELITNKYKVSILINNAAINPKYVNSVKKNNLSRVESFSLEDWDLQLNVGLKGAFICSKIFGSNMAKDNGGVIVNIASDLSVIAPDQRIYLNERFDKDSQPVKPVTYSVIKSGLIGMTKYLSTYWNSSNVRVNALSPGGVFEDQDPLFVSKLTKLIPLGRMANVDEYRSAIQFLCSDASSYMTGQNLVIDGGRSVW